MIKLSAIGDWMSDNVGTLLAGLLNVVIIVAVAVVLRFLAGRLIDQFTNRMVSSHARLSQSSSKMANRVLKQASTARAERQRQRAQTIASVLKSMATALIIGVAFVMVLSQLGINVAPILASAGVLGLAIGFGAQSLVQDFLAGIFMMSEDQYGVGDVIDTGDAVGTVEAVTLRTTKIRDLNGGLWHVRNGEILRVCNMNQDWANVVVELPLDSSVDLERATHVIQDGIDAFADHTDVTDKLLERPDISGVVAIGNGATTVRVIARTQPGEQWALDRMLRGQIKRSLDRHGIPIAHPGYMRQAPAWRSDRLRAALPGLQHRYSRFAWSRTVARWGGWDLNPRPTDYENCP
ncbi:MAG: mechanosensitive ion channel, partial [Streptosporangiales bacterium]|nr:mechanosensitive ion channel [Streptosporangiales bacterium]